MLQQFSLGGVYMLFAHEHQQFWLIQFEFLSGIHFDIDCTFRAKQIIGSNVYIAERMVNGSSNPFLHRQVNKSPNKFDYTGQPLKNLPEFKCK